MFGAQLTHGPAEAVFPAGGGGGGIFEYKSLSSVFGNFLLFPAADAATEEHNAEGGNSAKHQGRSGGFGDGGSKSYADVVEIDKLSPGAGP
jgi:hypothetical protein